MSYDIDARVAYLRDLEPGWLDGCGAAISETAIDGASLAHPVLAEAGDVPGMFPTESGGVLVEAFLPPSNVRSVEVEPDGRCVVLDLAAGGATGPVVIDDALAVLRQLAAGDARSLTPFAA